MNNNIILIYYLQTVFNLLPVSYPVIAHLVEIHVKII